MHEGFLFFFFSGSFLRLIVHFGTGVYQEDREAFGLFSPAGGAWLCCLDFYYGSEWFMRVLGVSLQWWLCVRVGHFVLAAESELFWIRLMLVSESWHLGAFSGPLGGLASAKLVFSSDRVARVPLTFISRRNVGIITPCNPITGPYGLMDSNSCPPALTPCT